jgi:hypothetical protein
LLHIHLYLVLYVFVDAYRGVSATVIGGIEAALAVLNADAPQSLTAREMLRSLVTEWDNAGRNLQRMVETHWTRYGRKLNWHLQSALRLNIVLGRGATTFIDGTTVLRAALGRLTPEDHERLALELFALLVIDARASRFGGPCDRCGRYYIKKRKTQKRYCGRRCAHLASAVKSTRKRLDAERAEKLRRAIRAAKIWKTARTQLGWKEWVSRSELDITPKFLTRAVNNGELTPPNAPQGRELGSERK